MFGCNFQKNKYVLELELSVGDNDYFKTYYVQFTNLEECKIWVELATIFLDEIDNLGYLTAKACENLIEKLLQINTLSINFSKDLEFILNSRTEQDLRKSFEIIFKLFDLYCYDYEMYYNLDSYKIYYIQQELIYNEIQI